MIKKHHYCFANISATKAQIVMKFYEVVNYYLVIICRVEKTFNSSYKPNPEMINLPTFSEMRLLDNGTEFDSCSVKNRKKASY